MIGKDSSKIKEPEKPTETITLENIKQEKYNYSISVDKIEFFKEETFVFLTATNNGKTTLFIDTSDSVIVQSGKQYKPLAKYIATYEELPYELARGASVTGVVAFPAISTRDLEFTLDIHSDDFDEELGEIVVRIGKENSRIIISWPKEPELVKPSKPTYASIVGTYQGTDVIMGSVTATFYSDGTLNVITSSVSFTGTWTQKNGQAHFTLIEPDGSDWTPQNVTVTSSGINGLWGEFFQRVG